MSFFKLLGVSYLVLYGVMQAYRSQCTDSVAEGISRLVVAGACLAFAAWCILEACK